MHTVPGSESHHALWRRTINRAQTSLTEELFTKLDWVEHVTAFLEITGSEVKLSGVWRGTGEVGGARGEWTDWTADATVGADIPVRLSAAREGDTLSFRQSGLYSIAGVFTRSDCAGFVPELVELAPLETDAAGWLEQFATAIMLATAAVTAMRFMVVRLMSTPPGFVSPRLAVAIRGRDPTLERRDDPLSPPGRNPALWPVRGAA